MLIKICGITSIDDALHAASCGADMIGLMFAPSRRRIDVPAARGIADAVGEQCDPVAVFQNEAIDTVVQVVRQIGARGIQLHGAEPPQVVDELAGRMRECFFIKAIGATGPETVEQMHAYYSAVKSRDRLLGFLVDTVVRGAIGGTGKVFGWDWLAEARRRSRLQSLPKLILAGGLTAENIEEAIQTVAPDGVDVSTGVESSPGRKDPKKVADFIAAARKAAGDH